MRCLGFIVAIVAMIAITDTIVVGENHPSKCRIRHAGSHRVTPRARNNWTRNKAIFIMRHENEAQIILDIGEAVDIYAVTGLTLLRTGHHTIRMQ
jgi:hypothetical protein